ncbi:hypothetical protein MO973_23550 [Paenibacillus sp. TRM 82003]|nr:hypothetical protein [Paenibacillus sp. TRM 82003]
MKHYGVKIALFAALILVCVFFGIDMATSGMERIAGPAGTAYDSHATATQAPLPSLPESQPAEAAASAEAGEDVSALPPGAAASDGPAANGAAEPSFINQAFLGLGDALRYVAQGLIRFVVAVFGSIIH